MCRRRTSSAFSRFAMIVQVTGGDDRNALRDLVERARRAALGRGLGRQPGDRRRRRAARGDRLGRSRTAARRSGVRPEAVTRILRQSVRRLRYLGGSEQRRPAAGRWCSTAGPAASPRSARSRIDPARPVLLRHVADIEMRRGGASSAFRINGRDATGLIVFQEEGANLVQLGRALRERVDERCARSSRPTASIS